MTEFHFKAISDMSFYTTHDGIRVFDSHIVVSENGMPGIPNLPKRFDIGTRQTRLQSQARESPHHNVTERTLLPARTPRFPQLTQGRWEAQEREKHPTAPCSLQASQLAVRAYLDKDIGHPNVRLGVLGKG